MSEMSFEIVVDCPDAREADIVIGQTVFAADANGLADVVASAYAADTCVSVRRISSGFVSYRVKGSFRKAVVTGRDRPRGVQRKEHNNV